MQKLKLRLSTTQIILLSFLLVIIVGSGLLSLPISSANGKSISYIDALFTATSATCVTGLVTVPTFSTWSIFGQAVILILIQIGGLGLITVISGFIFAFSKKMGFNYSVLIQDAFNLNTLSGLAEFIKKVLIGTLIIEITGALLYMAVFIPDFGAQGIWISVFTSVSAFCNAGMDIIGASSLVSYATNPLVNSITCILIVLGGLGFIVWWDVIRVIKEHRKLGLKAFSRLMLHSKIAILSTFILIIIGAILIFAFEFNNPQTLAPLSLFDKIQVSFFQSVTTRTAGFFTIDQTLFTDSSTILCIILMFIGGSPVGTPGGVKTVTVFVIIGTAIATIRGKNEISAFRRSISFHSVRKALAILFMAVVIIFTSTLLLSLSINAPPLDILYETASATATVGLSKNLTPLINTFGKIVIIFTMYTGRIGPLSLALALNSSKGTPNNISLPSEDISVG